MRHDRDPILGPRLPAGIHSIVVRSGRDRPRSAPGHARPIAAARRPDRSIFNMRIRTASRPTSSKNIQTGPVLRPPGIPGADDERRPPPPAALAVSLIAPFAQRIPLPDLSGPIRAARTPTEGIPPAAPKSQALLQILLLTPMNRSQQGRSATSSVRSASSKRNARRYSATSPIDPAILRGEKRDGGRATGFGGGCSVRTRTGPSARRSDEPRAGLS